MARCRMAGLRLDHSGRWPASPAPAASSLARVFRAALRTGLDVLYPPHCMACGTAIQGERGVCAACWQTVGFITRPYCERLGTPFAQDLGPGPLSPAALADPPVYARARAVARFDSGPVQALVHRFKYGDRPDYARVLGAWMARSGQELLADADLLVPVPLHPRRLWQRRFNQAALLAQAIGRRADKPVALEALVRVKPTRTQVGMSRAARAENIQGAFRVTPTGAARLHHRRVLLIDDVLTTGATANAAARVLLRGGATTVDVLVFARVVTDA
jgi:ComF family protein